FLSERDSFLQKLFCVRQTITVSVGRSDVDVEMNDLLPAIRPRIRDSEALFEQIDCRIPMSLIVRNDSKPAKGFYPHLDRHFRRVENAIVKLLRRIPLTSICRELAFVIRHDSFFERAQHAIVFVHKFDERLTLPEAHFLPTLAAKMFEF